ncbi:MAG TPA: COX15/CtaA family protein [Pyrinomonadaceae bacterium]|nr:COX15/CtaA family protein [Pyrinomonadaceae bacterium]
MENTEKLSKFAKYAWFVLAWNIVVILWGVFLRASKSGDGCGQHWLTCKGEVVPSAPELKTVIEFSHRITSSLDGLIVIGLVIAAVIVWYRRRSPESGRVMRSAIACLVFVIIEGLLGAGLVLTGNTAETLTPARPFWAAAHLVNTLILLAFLSLTAWLASGGGRIRFADKKAAGAIIAGIGLLLLVGISGSVAALASMLFPSATLAEGIANDFSATSNMLIRLRIVHPILSVAIAVFLIFTAGWLRTRSGGGHAVTRWSNILSLLLLAQIAFGAATLLMLAPIVMQLGHLLLADAVWISFILLSANFLSAESTA